MTQVVTLDGYTPPPRFDDNAWTAALVQHSATETGSYVLVESFTLDPVDTDPTNPLTRSFTTELGLPDYWYRIVWEDSDGDQSDPTSPVQNTSGNVPEPVTAYATADELASILKVNATTQAAALERVLASASGEINKEIGRDDLAGWELSLAEEVCLERAVEHWEQSKAPFGIVGLGSATGGFLTARDSWERHANKLAPLKRTWGLA